MISRLLFIADAHSGLKMGLWPPKFSDEFGTSTALGPSQRNLWKRIKTVKEQCREGCDELLLVLMSDLVHGPEEEIPGQMVTADVKTQCDAFIEAVLPISNRADKVYAIDALSRYHADPGRFADDYIASELGAFGKQAYVSFDLQVQDVRFRFAHHGPPLGTRPHLKGDSVRRFMRDAYTKGLQTGHGIPDAWVFAHWHQWHWEPLKVEYPHGEKLLQSYYCPPMSFPDKRTLRNVKLLDGTDVGVIALDVEGDSIKVNKWFTRYDVRKVIKHS